MTVAQQFEALINQRDTWEAEAATHSAMMRVLKAGQTNHCGLTSDAIKARPEWQRASKHYAMAATQLRRINSVLNKHYKAEMKQERSQRRSTRAGLIFSPLAGVVEC